MIPALLSLGKTSSSMGPVSFCLELSALLFSFGVVIWWILTMVRHDREKEARPIVTPPIPVIPMVAHTKKRIQQGAKALLLLVVGGMIGGPIGWGIHAHHIRAEKDKAFEEWKAQHVVYQKAFAAWQQRQPHSKGE